MKQNRVLNVKNMVLIGMFGALSAVLMFFQVSVPFVPPFYKVDFCEVPALIGGFAMGPVAGVIIEAVKIILKLVTQGTETMYVGELANFLSGISFVVPAALIYKVWRTKKGAMAGLAVGVVVLVAMSVVANVYLTLPFYGKVAFGGVENIIAMGTKLNGNIKDMMTFVIFAIVPFNLLKGIVVSVITALVYKRVSVVIRMGEPVSKKKNSSKKGVAQS